MKYILLFLSCVFIFKTVESAMNEAQLKNAAKLVRNVCQPKVKVSDKAIDDMHKGEFPDDDKLMCYMECVLRMGKLTKNGKLDVKSSLAQAATLPVERQELTKATVKNCSSKGQEDDKCVAAYEIAKCFYFDNPGNYFLP